MADFCNLTTLHPFLSLYDSYDRPTRQAYKVLLLAYAVRARNFDTTDYTDAQTLKDATNAFFAAQKCEREEVDILIAVLEKIAQSSFSGFDVAYPSADGLRAKRKALIEKLPMLQLEAAESFLRCKLSALAAP